MASRFDPDKNALLFAIRKAPKDTVWVYVRRVYGGMAHNSSTVTFNLADGESIDIKIPKGKEAEWEEKVRELAPQAALGYFQEIRDAFLVDPASARGMSGEKEITE
ncbi:hypothetical protein ACFL4W_02270 [Planctomycetota bacterium]